MSETFDNKVNFVGAPVSNVPLPEGFSFQFVPEITLRDYFAAKAMQGFCAAGNKISIDPHLFRREAELAYAVADAMLKAREA